ncbi:TPA: helix-turn-helix domain-containing protein [Streptococcus suis]
MNRIRDLRIEKNRTQKEIADLLGVTSMTISRWEKEEKPAIKHEQAQTLANYFNVNVDYLLGSSDEASTFKTIGSVLDNLDIMKKYYEIMSDSDNIEALKLQQKSYNILEKYIDDSSLLEKLLRNIQQQSYINLLASLIEFDKENQTNEARLLINYLTLEDTDKKIAFDLIQKLSDRNT